MIELEVNGEKVGVGAAPEKPLLYVLREDLGLTGTKYGCGIGECGSCMVHLDGEAVQSCQLSLAEVRGKRITTIE